MKMENEIQREIQLALAEVPGLRIWRGNVAKGWMGLPDDTHIETMQDGSKTVTIQNARRLDTHLPTGFSDLFGFIDADGRAIPVFIEVKSARGRPSPEQQAFLQAMLNAGCFAGVARSVEEAHRILKGERLL